ncbi:unnamed protein product [Trifolium pratense]|uniref:Uncharacterized protein n=1 Tax=Trifolium pratense TaxID=57577 RepID=A0ACB0IMF5_TRIPR|nr:unnamed protein product [Trifolium pratense]
MYLEVVNPYDVLQLLHSSQLLTEAYTSDKYKPATLNVRIIHNSKDETSVMFVGAVSSAFWPSSSRCMAGLDSLHGTSCSSWFCQNIQTLQSQTNFCKKEAEVGGSRCKLQAKQVSRCIITVNNACDG